jgi:hypothetical protein
VQHASGWEAFVWPQWLPVRARLPLIAQITGAVALTALIVGPWWASIPESPIPSTPVVPHAIPIPLASAVPKSSPVSQLDATSVAAALARPAHLNLDVRHSFAKVELSVTVDGKQAMTSKLDGSGKRFKMFGRRSERGFTHTLDLAPGVRVVRVRLQSPNDKFDQTRIERFDLGSASVAALQITADKSGMQLVAKHPPGPPKPAIDRVVPAPPPPAPALQPVASAVPMSPPIEARTSPAESAIVELVQSLRSMLIAIAGFVASAATGFVVQEFLRRRRDLIFADAEPVKVSSVPAERRRRKRSREPRATHYAPD